MGTLAIESSGKTAAIALSRGSGAPIERILSDVGRRHAQTLVSEIDILLREQGMAAKDCALIAVSIGPGSFTGLRVGVVAAKTLAYATRARLVAVDTFACIAENSPDTISEVYVIADAQRGGLFVGKYACDSSRNWKRLGEIQVVDAESWAGSLAPGDAVSGWGVEKIREMIPAGTIILEQYYWTPNATSVLRIGEALANEGKLADPFTLEPFYLRASAAEEKAATPNAT